MSKISVSPVREKAEARGITSIREFERQTGLHYITARRWWQDDVTQIHADTLVTLSMFFDCEPGELLKLVPEST